MLNKKSQRVRRARRIPVKVEQGDVPCLSVFRSNQHISVQLIAPYFVGDATGASKVSKTLLSASTTESAIREQYQLKNGSNKVAAMAVGKVVAERALKIGIQRVRFDRRGFKFHGRVKALADAAREAHLQF